MRPRKIAMLFEQSNTFRDQARALGYDAESYDIEGNPDHKMDLFEEFNRFGGAHMDLGEEDLAIAFFPCTRFVNQFTLNLRCDNSGMAKWPVEKKIRYSRERERSRFYEVFCDMMLWAHCKNIPLIVENPYSTHHYLIQYFPIRPKLVIMDRTKYGDDMRKPTAFWFVNCEPCMFVPESKPNKDYKRIGSVPYGIERSLIQKEFARRFLEGFVGLEEKI